MKKKKKNNITGYLPITPGMLKPTKNWTQIAAEKKLKALINEQPNTC